MIAINKSIIIFIHGFLGNPNDFGKLINDLKKDYDVCYFTLPGHDKKRVKINSKEDWLNKAEDELQKIIQKKYKNIYIIGHSMGGIIAVYLASKYKEITKIVLASPGYKFSNRKRLNLITGIIEIKKFTQNYPPKLVIANIIRAPQKTLNEFINLSIEHQNDINKTTCPTLILWGEEDTILPKDRIKYVYNNLSSKSVTLITIKNVNHNTFINNRYNEIKENIIAFLNTKNENVKKETQI